MSGLDKTEAAELKQTTVEEGTQFKGTLESTCRVVVRGAVDGELNAPAIEVAETGTVTGRVKAQSLHSSGVLAGHIDVDELVLAGWVRGDTVIRAKTLEVRLQQRDPSGKIELKFAECMLEVGDDPALEQLPEPSGAQKSPGSTSKRAAANGGQRNSEVVAAVAQVASSTESSPKSGIAK